MRFTAIIKLALDFLYDVLLLLFEAYMYNNYVSILPVEKEPKQFSYKWPPFFNPRHLEKGWTTTHEKVSLFLGTFFLANGMDNLTSNLT
jgi:hypothetical protein